MTDNQSVPGKHNPRSPQRHDEQWAGGSMPGTTADDSVDEIVAEMDLYQDEEPEEVNLAEQVGQVEKNRHFDAEE